MEKKLNACVCGFGIVGKATAKILNIDAHYDILPTLSNISLQDAARCKYIFICLPTPTIEGKCQVRPITDLIEAIEGWAQYPYPTYIIRSTVIPGTADSIMRYLSMDRIISNPEFLTESKWEQDIENPFVVVLGGRDIKLLSEVRNLYETIYDKSSIPVISTDNVTAEIIKYSLNCFFSSKVVFANTIYDIAERAGADYEAIKEAMESCPYVGQDHFEVRFKGKRGVRGKCLPKDLEAFANWSLDDLFLNLLQANRRIIDTRK